LRSVYDFIFIDAQAGVEDMARIAMSRGVSDEVVVVSEYDPMSAAGVERLKAVFRDDLTYDRTWILLNKILPEFAKSFTGFLEVAKYLSPIPWDAEVVRAYSRRRLAIDSDDGNAHTLAVLKALRGLCGELIQQELETWVSSRAAVIRQPIEQQYADAEQELALLLAQRLKLSKSKELRKLAFISGAAVVSMVAAVANFFEADLMWLVLAVSAVAVAFTAIFVEGAFERPRVETQLEEGRFERQHELLKDRLKRLELLKSLDPENLLQRKGL
jgi:hypothetical protein